MKWQKEPTCDGWYWIRAKTLTPRVTKVFRNPHGRWQHDFYPWPFWSEHAPYEFAGPIPKPEET